MLSQAYALTGVVFSSRELVGHLCRGDGHAGLSPKANQHAAVSYPCGSIIPMVEDMLGGAGLCLGSFGCLSVPDGPK